MRVAGGLLIAMVLAVCWAGPAHADPVTSIYWSDGDSGTANGVKFRLADVDAPETGGVGARGGAKCEAERKLGYAAKEFIVNRTRDQKLEIEFNGETDNFGRRVAIVTVEGVNVGHLGIVAGHLRPYVFEGKRATMPKPKWCSGT
jgi:endonuclease YncB( thermonuclease family)